MYASAHFGEIGINGGNFANGLFSGERTNDLFLSSSDAGIDFSLGSTTASDATSSIDFLTKATLSSNLRMRITNSGLIMAGTSTPAWDLSRARDFYRTAAHACGRYCREQWLESPCHQQQPILCHLNNRRYLHTAPYLFLELRHRHRLDDTTTKRTHNRMG